MATVKSFEDLEIWKEGIAIAVDVYDLCKQGELAKDFGLKVQVRRSTVSIAANIAEGFEYNNRKEFKRFLAYSKGSGGELRSHLTVLYRLGYINQDVFSTIQERLKTQAKKLLPLSNTLTKPPPTNNNLKPETCNLQLCCLPMNTT